MDRVPKINYRTGKVTYGRTRRAEASQRAAMEALPSVLAVQSSQAPVTPPWRSNDGAPSRASSSRAGSAGPSGRAEDDEPDRPAHPAHPAQQPEPAEHIHPTQPAYNYERDEPAQGFYGDDGQRVEMPQAKRRGPVSTTAATNGGITNLERRAVPSM